MKRLFTIITLLLLAGCVSPYIGIPKNTPPKKAVTVHPLGGVYIRTVSCTGSTKQFSWERRKPIFVKPGRIHLTVGWSSGERHSLNYLPVSFSANEGERVWIKPNVKRIEIRPGMDFFRWKADAEVDRKDNPGAVQMLSAVSPRIDKMSLQFGEESKTDYLSKAEVARLLKKIFGYAKIKLISKPGKNIPVLKINVNALPLSQEYRSVLLRYNVTLYTGSEVYGYYSIVLPDRQQAGEYFDGKVPMPEKITITDKYKKPENAPHQKALGQSAGLVDRTLRLLVNVYGKEVALNASRSSDPKIARLAKKILKEANH